MLHLVTFGLSDQLLIITNHPRHILCSTDAGLTNVTAFLDQDLNWNFIHSQVPYASIEVNRNCVLCLSVRVCLRVLLVCE